MSFTDASMITLLAIRANLLRGLDAVAAHLDAGTFHVVGPKGAASPAQAGQVTLVLLTGVDAELAARGVRDGGSS